MIAHIGGVPVEEALFSAIGGGGAALLVARGWIMVHLRRGRQTGARAHSRRRDRAPG